MFAMATTASATPVWVNARRSGPGTVAVVARSPFTFAGALTLVDPEHSAAAVFDMRRGRRQRRGNLVRTRSRSCMIDGRKLAIPAPKIANLRPLIMKRQPTGVA
jgi:hypothetical protein